MVHSFRSFISNLETRGDLIRFGREVDSAYELTSVLWKMEKKGKAVLFEKVKGKSIPIVGGLFQSLSRIHLALDIVSEYANADVISEKIEYAMKNPLPIRIVKNGPAKEVIIKGENVNLHDLPIPIFFKGDAGPYITAGVCIAKHLDSGTLNMGIYRVQILGKNKIIIYGSPLSDFRKICTMAETKGYTNIEVALAIGVDPAVLLAAILKPRADLSELEIAGGLKGEQIKVVECETVDLLVPHDAELVLEGKVNLKEKALEGPVGDITGYYATSVSPVVQLTALCHRSDPIFHAILPGPSNEHYTLANIQNFGIKKKILEILKSSFINVKNVNIIWDSSTGGMMKLIISIRHKASEEDPRKILETVFNLKFGEMCISSFIKQVIIVDEDVNIYDSADIEWAINNRTPDDSRILILANVPSWPFDRGVRSNGCSVRIGIDATKALGKCEELKRVNIPS